MTPGLLYSQFFSDSPLP